MFLYKIPTVFDLKDAFQNKKIPDPPTSVEKSGIKLSTQNQQRWCNYLKLIPPLPTQAPAYP